MVVLTQNDYLEVKLASLIADYDRETLYNLYQPIVGYQALAVYMTLWCEANNEKVTSACTHGQLLNRMKIEPGTFVEARKALEAVGLLKTFLTKESKSKFYHYELYAPKSPKKFFDNTLLYGMLIKVLGETEANRFKNIYQFENQTNPGEDISASFVEVFNPDFEDQAFFSAMNTPNSVDRVTAKVLTKFNWETFINSLNQISQISEEAFTKKDMKEIDRLATLNGVNEIDTAQAVANIYDAYAPKGKHIDFDKLGSLLRETTEVAYVRNEKRIPTINSSKSDLGRKINIMEKLSPNKYLSIVQNGTKPASSDLSLVDDLSKNYGFSNGVINALIDFVLAVNNNILSRPYCEKIAASLAREGVKTALDAMEYLKNTRKNKKQATSKYNNYSDKIKNNKTDSNDFKSSEAKKDDEKKEESLDWDALLNSIADDGGSNGQN